MTNQEAFDKVWDWFVVRGKPASLRPVTHGYGCVYRGENGTRCAAGVLIPDELYRLDMENMSIREVINQDRRLAEYFAGVSEDLLRSLQQAHDGLAGESDFAEEIEGSLIEVAAWFSLAVPA